MSDHSRQQPQIVAFISDLMISTKIEGVANHLGYSVTFIGDATLIISNQPVGAEKQLAEPVSGSEALLIDRLTNWQPALLIFDLANEAIPWREWLAMLKSSPASRRFPVLCFGPHVAVDTLESARNLGAEAVVARSRFLSAMPQLIEKFAAGPDYGAIRLACREPLSNFALEGLLAFNRGDYFLSHEYLEDAWNDDDTVAREAYRAILQVAVAYLQIERRNYNGAVKMFLRARQWLAPLPDSCRGIDFARLRNDANDAYSAITKLGADNLGEFELSDLRPIKFEQHMGNE